jgi:hypothetical protein
MQQAPHDHNVRHTFVKVSLDSFPLRRARMMLSRSPSLMASFAQCPSNRAFGKAKVEVSAMRLCTLAQIANRIVQTTKPDDNGFERILLSERRMVYRAVCA